MAYFLYYAGYEKSSGLEQIGLATSMDLHTWKRVSPKPIIPAGSAGECDIEQTSNPCVLKHEGRFKMWYQGRSSSGAASVCFAESPDGIVWQVKKGPVLAPAGEGYRVGYHQPHVLFNEAKSCFQMWVTLHDGSASKIVYAESSDGLSWNFLENNAVAPEGEWEGNQLYYPFVKREKEGYAMWYTGRSKGHTWAIGRASSRDGINWKKDANNPALPKSRSSELFRRLADVLAPFRLRTFAAAYGSASPFVFDHNGARHMLTHDTGGKKRLAMSLYVEKDGAWQPVKHDILREGAEAWESYFQADPFLLIV